MMPSLGALATAYAEGRLRRGEFAVLFGTLYEVTLRSSATWIDDPAQAEAFAEVYAHLGRPADPTRDDTAPDATAGDDPLRAAARRAAHAAE
ncbi:hypothetical protein ACFO4E_24190 [Nocardiopsis mangrovi]|uniref:Uncharacterized protein n=1 Tax=Nocardiopsis mangrovi TaxID=1179818 RepID=A0ABV9E2N6_9ACTN